MDYGYGQCASRAPVTTNKYGFCVRLGIFEEAQTYYIVT